jgi:hypothetical protein
MGLFWLKRQQCDQKIKQNFAQFFEKVAKNQNIYIKAEFESPKHQHQTTFETLYNKTRLETTCVFKNLLSKK